MGQEWLVNTGSEAALSRDPSRVPGDGSAVPYLCAQAACSREQPELLRRAQGWALQRLNGEVLSWEHNP